MSIIGVVWEGPSGARRHSLGRDLTHRGRAHCVAGRICCYLRREGTIYLTYWTTDPGDEVLNPVFGLLDLTAYGRREAWEASPEGWPQSPTHSFLRTDEHGAPTGPRSGGRPVPQWTRPGVTGVGGPAG